MPSGFVRYACIRIAGVAVDQHRPGGRHGSALSEQEIVAGQQAHIAVLRGYVGAADNRQVLARSRRVHRLQQDVDDRGDVLFDAQLAAVIAQTNRPAERGHADDLAQPTD